MVALKKNERNLLPSGEILYPMVETLSVMNCNAYVLATEEAILVLDPGGTEDRAAALQAVVEEFLADKVRPVALLLTHCHWDHINALNYFTPEFRAKLTLIFSVDTAEILSKPDDDYTAAKFFGNTMPVIKPDLLLFGKKTGQCGIFSVKKSLDGEELYADGKLQLIARYAPGHSPDGVFYFHNDIAFIGDLFFSLNPGVVGVAGWNAEQFRKSAILLRDLSEDQALTYCNGHSLITQSDAVSADLQSLIANAFLFEHATPMSLAIVKSLKNYYFLLLREIKRLLGIFTERLHYLGNALEKMGENAVGEKFVGNDLFHNLEQSVTQFNEELAKRSQGGEVAPLMLAILGARMVHKLKKNLEGNPYRELLDPSLSRRIEFLLTDFSNALACLPFAEEKTEKLLYAEGERFIQSLQMKIGNDDIPTDSDEAFLQFVMKKLVRKNKLQRCHLTLNEHKEDFPVSLCWDHFEEAVRDLLERLADAGETEIHLEIIRDGLLIQPQKGIPEHFREEFSQGLGCEFLRRIDCRTGFTPDAVVILVPEQSL